TRLVLHPCPTRRSSDLVPGKTLSSGCTAFWKPLLFHISIRPDEYCRFSTCINSYSNTGYEYLHCNLTHGHSGHCLYNDGRHRSRSEEHTSELQSRFDLV